MENLIILLFDFCLFGLYLIIGLIIAILIQVITYWLTGFSIYKWLNKKLFKEIKK